MGKINYQKIYITNKDEWKALTREPQKYEALLAGHYSESNHFVYELLQNAEDEKADQVVIEYYDDKLVFYHNGIPFDENDVRGVSSMLMGTKDRNSAQTIGRFGMGFKSVFKYTYQPEIYSDEEAFRIENYLLPVEIQNGWDYRRVMKELEYGLSSGGKYYPFSEQKHLTKIVIPFAKRKNDGTVIPVSGKEVLQKLQELNGEILLFLNHIKKLFWINQTNGKYAMITLDVDSTDCNLNSCRIEGSAFQQKEEITRYLKFKKTFDHPEMKDAEVSVAYKVNNKANVVYELKGEPVWVYFPTRDMTKLPFLIHGSFETAVSREKLMTPSEFNSALFQLLGDLIADSMEELKKRKLITQNFIRKVLIAAFKDETDNNTIPGLRNKITECLKKGSLIPDKDGDYYSVDELVIPVPFGIADFYDSKLFQTTFEDVGHFVAYNNEREANFNEYLAWMVDEVGVQTFTLVDWAKRMGNLKGICVPTKSAEYEKLEDFYDFLSDNRESIYTTGLRYSRSGRYEQTIRNNVSTAWKILKTSPIILNAQEELTAPYQGETEKLYLSATSDYQQMVLSSIVHKNVSAKFGQLLKDGFTLTDFDNFQYVKEKILKKYIKGETINFDNSENYEDEYIEDLNQILLLFAKNHNVDEIQNLIAKASIIKIVTDDNTVTFAKPALTYAANSVEGADLRIYYETPVVEDDEEDDESYYREFDDSGKYLIDEAFYHNHGISVKKLQQFGIITTPITEGRRYFSGGSGKESWNALGDFCPEMTMDYLDDNLYIIEYMPKSELARKKSSEIFKLVLSVRHKLAGRLSKRKTNPYEVEEESRILRRLKSYHSWLYDKSGNLREPREISKYDLDTSLYGEVIPDKNFYSMLGFIETEDDNTAEAFEHVDKLDTRNKKLLLRQLARELGMKVSDGAEDDTNNDEENKDDIFSADTYVSEAFPVSRVRNIESLIEHVRQQFFCADPVTYHKVLRQIRTSKSKKADRAYVTGMYLNDSHVKICQMCKKPSTQVYVTEVANYGIELPQMNLCLCPNCSGHYKSLRDNNKEAFKEAMKVAILSLNIEENSDEYEIQLDSDTSLYFTETHVAEIQTILGLISEYGVPDGNQEERLEKALMETEMLQEKIGSEQAAATLESGKMLSEPEIEEKLKDANQEEKNEPTINESDLTSATETEFDFLTNTEPIQDGNLVSYKKMQTLEIVDAVMDSTKYPLHKAFLGKKVGDLVVLNGRRYLIISIL